MSERHVFQPWEGLPVTPAPLDPDDPKIHAPHTDPLPMDPHWYTHYKPEADDAMHESYREDTEAMRPLLKEELDQASAALTGREVACVLTTRQGVYSGHVEERPGAQFITAPAMALAKLGATELADAEITGIYLMGQNIKKPKYVMPSPEDYDRLAERFIDWGPTIIIVDPVADEYTSVWASVHSPAYSVKEPSDLRYMARDEEDETPWIEPLEYVTPLTRQDAEFVADLATAGSARGLEIYLTGSASGRGEISNALKNDYEDIDLLVVAGDNDPDEVKRALIARSQKHFGPLRVEPMTSYDYETGQSFPGLYLYDANGNKKVQMHIGKTLGAINYRPGNFERNFFHRIS